MFSSVISRLSRKLLILETKSLLLILSIAFNRYQQKNNLLTKSNSNLQEVWQSVKMNEETTLKHFQTILKRRLEELSRGSE